MKLIHSLKLITFCTLAYSAQAQGLRYEHISDSTYTLLRGLPAAFLSFSPRASEQEFRKMEDNLHDANYFVTPSARPYIQGYGLYRNQMLFMNSIGYGFTKHFSAAVGFEFSSLFRNEKVFFGMGKVSAEIAGNVYLALGALQVRSQEESKITQGFTALTFGDQEMNLSLGGSFGRYFGLSRLQLTYNFSGYYQFNDMVAAMTENHLIPGVNGKTFYLGFHGARIVTGDNGFDLGLAYTTADKLAFEWSILPFVGYNLLF